MKLKRRDLIGGIGGLSAGFILSGCAGANRVLSRPPNEEGEVTATEDLMREHGVLRRALFVYSEVAVRLRSNVAAVAPDAILRTARLFRTFGEDYHERKLEETFIFPSVKKAGGEASTYPDILKAQHDRGREITEYILAVTKTAKLNASDAEPLALTLDSMVRMYRAHAAREDTIVFPAWKATLTGEQLDEMNETFEDIEHEMFGEEGFEKAVRQISDIEAELGMADLKLFTAPPATIK
jgi:hemerythrin-like domain-containing protein